MLKGRTALITGSTSGIELGIAEAFARAGANLVLNGFGVVTVEEVAALAAFLAGDAAASITGTILPIDGGWTAH